MEIQEWSPVDVDVCFKGATEQADVLIALYRLAYLDWDDIDSIDGWPRAGEALNQYIFERFIKFDKFYHPGVLPGGLWMNRGFSSFDAEHLGPWELELAPYTLKEGL